MIRPLIRDPRVTDRPAYVEMVGPLLAHGDGPEHVRAQMIANAATHRALEDKYRAEGSSFGAALCKGKAEAFAEAAAALVLYSDFDVPRDAR